MNKTISVIPAKTRFEKVNDMVPKLRVAAYCRVSTDNEEQLSSYEAQVNYYSAYISNNPQWENAGIYADEGISGTNTKKRTQFNKLIEDCMDDKIDMVVTKSISRFARNTLDCLNYVRQLKDKNIPVFFEKENINSLDSKGEIMLTIMSSLAQEESRSLSTNVKWGITHRFQNGEIMVNHNRFLGYTKDEKGKLVIDPEGAEIVKRIYREYLEGASLLEISRSLERDKILTAAGKAKWRSETIKKILKNEKYIGDALLQKTYTVDFLSKKRVINNGIVPQYYVKNSHEAIIPRELYMQVQEEMVRRSNLYTGKSKRIYSSKFALSSIVFCGHCKDIYRRVHWNNRGKKIIVWRCVSRLEEKGSKCKSRTILEENLQSAVLRAINSTITGKDDFIKVLKNNIETVLKERLEDTDEIEKKLVHLQEELIRCAGTSMESDSKYNSNYESLVQEINALREKKQKINLEKADKDVQKFKIAKMLDFLEQQPSDLLEYDDKLVRQLIEKITVNDKNLIIEFKSGIEVEEQV